MDDPNQTANLKQRFKQWMQRLLEKFSPHKSTEQLIGLIAKAEQDNVIGVESRIMMEGVLKISQMHVAEIMIPAPKMDMLDIDMNLDDMLGLIIDIGHSRYPVYENEKDKIGRAHV